MVDVLETTLKTTYRSKLPHRSRPRTNIAKRASVSGPSAEKVRS
jgi:hypothetical protein